MRTHTPQHANELSHKHTLAHARRQVMYNNTGKIHTLTCKVPAGRVPRPETAARRRRRGGCGVTALPPMVFDKKWKKVNGGLSRQVRAAYARDCDSASFRATTWGFAIVGARGCPPLLSCRRSTQTDEPRNVNRGGGLGVFQGFLKQILASRHSGNSLSAGARAQGGKNETHDTLCVSLTNDRHMMG